MVKLPIALVKAGGSVIFTLAVPIQFAASVTVMLWIPALKFVTFWVVEVFPVQEIVYGVTPPEIFVVAAPSLPPKHFTPKVLVMATDGPAISFTRALATAVQLLASVTVKVYGPAGTDGLFKLDVPLLHKYCKGAVPPATVALVLPLFCPQLEFVAVTAVVNAGGSTKVKVKVV